MYWQILRSIARLSLLAAVSTPFIFAANVVNVLWYTAATTDGGTFADYKTGVEDLASNAPSSVAGNPWNVTFWDSGTAPSGTYNVLVVASPQFIDGADYSALNAQIPAFGDRVLITGIDADWHYFNTPGPGIYDGPEGFLLNAVDWAAAGNGMGAVFLAPQSYVSWNFTGLGTEAPSDGLDNISIPANTQNFPVVSGISSTGLSNWATSGKETWSGFDITQWTALQVSGDDPTLAVTLASSATAGQGLGGADSSTPEPSTAALFLAAPAALWMLRRKR